MELKSSFKELYDTSLKTTYPIEINGRQFEEGETIAFFDRITMANMTERKKHISATGGFDNRNLVSWDFSQGIDLQFTQGVFSRLQFALMNNAKMITFTDVVCDFREEVESDETGIIELKNGYGPITLFIYNIETGEKLTYTKIDNIHYNITTPYLQVLVTYTAEYQGGGSNAIIGKQLTTGYLSLEGKTRIQDDVVGQTTTGIIKIPKLQLMSELSLTLGKKANPLSGVFNATAYPVGSRGNERSMDIFFLNDDIDSDM